MGTDVARGVVNQTQTSLGGPVLPEDFQLRNSRDPEGQHSSQRRSQLLVLDHLPNLEDTRVVSSRCSSGQLRGVGQSLPHDDGLVEGQGPSLVDVVENGLGLPVGKLALPRPSPTETSMAVPNIKGPLHPDVEPLHGSRS